jgi:hypothetical protein
MAMTNGLLMELEQMGQLSTIVSCNKPAFIQPLQYMRGAFKALP